MEDRLVWVSPIQLNAHIKCGIWKINILINSGQLQMNFSLMVLLLIEVQILDWCHQHLNLVVLFSMSFLLEKLQLLHLKLVVLKIQLLNSNGIQKKDRDSHLKILTTMILHQQLKEQSIHIKIKKSIWS